MLANKQQQKGTNGPPKLGRFAQHDREMSPEVKWEDKEAKVIKMAENKTYADIRMAQN